jgi:succinoglycan biosynthesis protein ExoL
MSNADDAHQRKLVRALRRRGYDTKAIGFSRDDYYRTDPSRDAVTIVGAVAHESYLTRLPVYLHSLGRVRQALVGANIVIAFSSELVLLARAATAATRSSPHMIREFCDVPRAVDGAGWRPAVARAIDRWGLRHVDAVVVTAEEFIDGYLRPRMRYSGPVAVLSNKPDLTCHSWAEWKGPTNGGRLEILYPGVIRCRRSIEVLRAVVEADDQVSVSVRGHNLTGMPVGEAENLRFKGPYRSPEDLATVYGRCHVVYSGYPYAPDRSNYSLARTNRFYEAVTFSKPQIAHAGTADARVVAERELGIVIEPSDVRAAAKSIVSVPVNTWQEYANNARRLASEWSTYDDDVGVAIAELRGKLGCP